MQLPRLWIEKQRPRLGEGRVLNLFHIPLVFQAFLAALAFVPMLGEALRSWSNEHRLRAAGAVEPPDDVFAAMQVIYPACFVAMIGESWILVREPALLSIIGLLVFGLAKVLKYWVIATLGHRWTFRVLVPPGSERTLSGPYRYLRHPNYLAVLSELAGFMLLAQAYWAGMMSLAAFGVLLIARIRVEERALGLTSTPPRSQSRR